MPELTDADQRAITGRSKKLTMDQAKRALYIDFEGLILPKLVFRLKENQSKMYFLDYLRFTTEGQSVLEQVIANFENLDQHLEAKK